MSTIATLKGTTSVLAVMYYWFKTSDEHVCMLMLLNRVRTVSRVSGEECLRSIYVLLSDMVIQKLQ